ncbi:hypothetical protein FQN54_000296 [Arachnomyces sp. PD_36]|nr:hypothetical protein FQN54_000296 [Arachnomyces sp. PD_36]
MALWGFHKTRRVQSVAIDMRIVVTAPTQEEALRAVIRMREAKNNVVLRSLDLLHDKCANCSPAGDGSPTETGGEELRYSESTSLHGVDDTNIDDGRSSSKTERSRAWVVKRWLAQLGVMEKPLGPGEVRVRWKCCCGIRLFDDYLDTDTDGLREVQHFLDHSGEIREASNPAGQQPNGPATRNSWFSSFITPIINALSNPLRDRASQPSLPTHNSQSSQIPHGTASSIGPMLLLLCMSTGDLGIQLDQRCIKSLGSDRELFHFLQEVYFKRRGKLRSRFSLRMPIGVKFVEFSLLTSSYVDIHEHEAVCSDACRCLPPKILVDEAEYKYSPAPPKRSPPIGPTAMAHYLKNPSHVKERHVWILNQLPKKLKGELEEKLDDDVTGWGIHVEEGPNWGKVWLALMVVFISGSALFGILWSVFKQDDYDCFYASVFEAENPALKSLPLAVQQKQIVVTCNYEARRRGLHKLQLISEARKVCPDAVIVLGEDLTRFRDASKRLYAFLKGFIWGERAERLGFDEVFLDVTNMIDYNVEVLNKNDLRNSFFHLDRSDPTIGFAYDASSISGPTYPAEAFPGVTEYCSLYWRVLLGSHLARYLRLQLEEHHGYTATVGISTSKLLSKLAGNVHKPKNQTTIIPPYGEHDGVDGNVIRFLDDHEIGKIPGIGFKIAQKIRAHVLGKEPKLDNPYTSDTSGDSVTVKEAREFPNLSPQALERILGGAGSPKGIGLKIWDLLHGIDPSEVAQGRSVPKQISIEDSYSRIDSLENAKKELTALARSLIRRMRVDLLEDKEESEDGDVSETPQEKREEVSASSASPAKRWLAHPRTLRLSTRSRPPDGSRDYTFNRISTSRPLPSFIFGIGESVEALAERLVNEALVPAFRRLHPEKGGWGLSLMNVAVTNMVDSAGEQKGSEGRDIGRMFRRQEHVLKEWRVVDHEETREGTQEDTQMGDTDETLQNEESMAGWDQDDDAWDSDEDMSTLSCICEICGASIPHFAVKAHEIYHSVPNDDT